MNNMKTEITLENKAKFFAQYWGQKVLFHTNSRPYFITFESFINSIEFIDNYSSYLKPLSSITDEDAAVIGSYRYKDAKLLTHIEIGKGLVKEFLGAYKTKLERFEVDYLRSKEYALPFMNLSVEEMVEAGWIRLTQ